jgi:hypothetical protein
MPTTDRRARRLAIARRRPRPVRQGSDEWFRRLAKAFRRMEMYQIARRWERIAAQPRVGDTLIDWRGYRRTVDSVYPLGVVGFAWSMRGVTLPWVCDADQWREHVRRARRTQEGSAHD